MAFVQLVVFGTSQIDKVREMAERYQEETKGRSKVRRVTVGADLDAPGRYATIVEFDSREDAEANNNLPETQAFAEEMNKFADGPVAYHNLDVLQRYEA
jgi:quinol monooxygenase YgiN